MKVFYLILGFTLALFCSTTLSHAEVRTIDNYGWVVVKGQGTFDGDTFKYTSINQIGTPRISTVCVDNYKFVMAFKTSTHRGGVTLVQMFGSNNKPLKCN